MSKYCKVGVKLTSLIHFEEWATLKCLHDNNNKDYLAIPVAQFFLRNRWGKNELNTKNNITCTCIVAAAICWAWNCDWRFCWAAKLYTACVATPGVNICWVILTPENSESRSSLLNTTKKNIFFPPKTKMKIFSVFFSSTQTIYYIQGWCSHVKKVISERRTLKN